MIILTILSHDAVNLLISFYLNSVYINQMDSPFSSSIANIKRSAQNSLQFSFQGAKETSHTKNAAILNKTQEDQDSKHSNLQNSTRIKLKDYMKLSCIMKRSRSKNSTQSPLKVAESNDFSEGNASYNKSTQNSDGRRSSIYQQKEPSRKRSLNLDYIGEGTPKNILKQEISNQIAKLQKKLEYLSESLEMPSHEKYDSTNELTDLCQIQRIIEDKISPELEKANKLIKKSRENGKIQDFMNEATTFLSEISKQKTCSKNYVEKMSPLKRIKYMKEKGQCERSIMHLNSICAQTKSRKNSDSAKKPHDQFYC